jgi:hypothetical protein
MKHRVVNVLKLELQLWSSCLNGQQNRTCNDLNSCGTTTLKPNETQSCECVENWSCSSWSSCLDGQQDRTCNDLNSCGTTTNKPDEEQNCSEDNTTLEDTTTNRVQVFVQIL